MQTRTIPAQEPAKKKKAEKDSNSAKAMPETNSTITKKEEIHEYINPGDLDAVDADDIKLGEEYL